MNATGRPERRLCIERLVFVLVAILAAVLLLTQLDAPEDEKHCTVSPDLHMKCTEREP
jgi:hypothetical protein